MMGCYNTVGLGCPDCGTEMEQKIKAITPVKDWYKLIEYIDKSDNQIISFSGRSGTGKSTLAYSIASCLCEVFDKNVFMFVPIGEIVKPWNRYGMAPQYPNSRLYINTLYNYTYDMIGSVLENHKVDKNYDYVIIDYELHCQQDPRLLDGFLQNIADGVYGDTKVIFFSQLSRRGDRVGDFSLGFFSELSFVLHQIATSRKCIGLEVVKRRVDNDLNGLMKDSYELNYPWVDERFRWVE